MSFTNPDNTQKKTNSPPSRRAPVLPSDPAAEQAVLGSILLSKDAAAEVLDRLSVDDFYVGKHADIFAAMLDIYAKPEPIDVITVSAYLKNKNQLEQIGGEQYLHGLAGLVPTPANINYYANRITDQSTRRRLVVAGEKIFRLGLEGEEEVSELVNLAQSEVYTVTSEQTRQDYIKLPQLIANTVQELDGAQGGDRSLRGVETGFTDLDRLTNGLHPGQMIIIAARPSMGKSTLALDFARAASIRQNLPVVFFSLEMSRQDIGMRLLSAEAMVLLQNIRHGRLSERDWGALGETQGKLENAPMFIDDSPNINLVEIRAKCRRLKREGLGLIVVDYLQLLSSARRVENRQQEVSDFSRSLKLLAKELSVPVVALSQLNRGPEQRADKRPGLADLRESGSIEQDADLVLLLHREDYYDRNSSRLGEADLIVAKHRNGPTDVITVTFQGSYSRFTNFIQQNPAPYG